MTANWKVGTVRQDRGIKVEAMVISVFVDCDGYSITIRATDGTETEYDFRPDLAKSLAEGLAAVLHEYGGIEVANRTTRH